MRESQGDADGAVRQHLVDDEERQRTIWWGERDSRETQMVLRDIQWREKASKK